MKKNHYYCNCTKDHSKEANKGKTPIREVTTDKEGICNNCGYYAIATTEKVKSRKDLYALLRITE
jgi:hypothetical protein